MNESTEKEPKRDGPGKPMIEIGPVCPQIQPVFFPIEPVKKNPEKSQDDDPAQST